VFTTLTVEGILGAGKLFFYPIKLCTFSLQNSVFLFCNKHGMAIANVNRRLQLYYGEDRKVVIQSELGKGTYISLKIPKSGGFDDSFSNDFDC
ncbi:hypothetical protein P9727_20195, partial [Parageobacillus thermoglucosidasius]|uniref:sensor histidine kinase n=1 Tax=Parageobacillus thermoglucosidasius TaxID=1426 RepID=UPI002E1FD85E|nr:hypothetical protein [Parageobacillus thermoglucosidasius]